MTITGYEGPGGLLVFDLVLWVETSTIHVECRGATLDGASLARP
jgi:hypothetical protein